jgi:hypothetical protein
VGDNFFFTILWYDKDGGSKGEFRYKTPSTTGLVLASEEFLQPSKGQ